MRNTRNELLGGAVTALLLVAGVPALAQQSTSTAPMTGTNAPDGRLEEYHGAFRASDLVGATVYNEQGSSVGKVNDLLLDTAGKADKVVISVGGFLGIDSKYVDVSFSELKIEHSRVNSTSNGMGLATTGANSTSSAPAGISNGTGTATGLTPNPPAMATGSDSNHYYSLVMPGATKDSLTKMPEFKYSS